MFLTKGVSCENNLIESISEITKHSDSIIEIRHLNYSSILEVGIVCVITCFDIQERLFGQLNDTLTILSSIPQTVASALSGYILSRAKPGLCQLLQHYVVREINHEDY